MRNDITFKKVKGVTVPKIRIRVPCAKVFKDNKQYSRKTKHKGVVSWE